MSSSDYHSLFAALNTAADILHRNRTPDPQLVAAFDTLKQARAMLEKAIQDPDQNQNGATASAERAAA